MSILYNCDVGCFISCEDYINSQLSACENAPKINENLFKILSPYSLKTSAKKTSKKCKQSNIERNKEIKKLNEFFDFKEDIKKIHKAYLELLPLLRAQGFLKKEMHPPKNIVALKTAEVVYEKSGKDLVNNLLGSNYGPAMVKNIENSRFIFPRDCSFFSKDVNEIDTHFKDKSFDLILLDPPWWNKYIRRKRKKSPHAYNMMYNCDLKKIPIESLLDKDGIVVVWCTNSPQHLETLINSIFPKWGVQYVGKWFWLKVTMFGEPVCEFSEPPGKQPFEQIIFGFKNTRNKIVPTNSKLLVSIPSAIHSHKPPLVEVLQPFLPRNPKCLEIFARYLLPDWTSYGNEVLRFQHESLYIFK